MLGNQQLAIIIIFLLGFLSFLLTKYLIKFCFKRKLLNYPNERNLHHEPKPRMGGVAIVVTWFIGLIVLYSLGFVEQHLFFALLSGLPIAIVSFIDDLVEIKPPIRISVHFLSSILAFYFLGGMMPLNSLHALGCSKFILYPLSILGMAWFINLFNFMDGTDGYAAIEAISIALMLFVFSKSLILLLLAIVVLGFLYWNWPKSKIFMGDTGSTQLGFVLIVFGIYIHNQGQFSILNWLIMALPFWFDATFTLIRRMINHENVVQAHKKHVYQRIVQAGYTTSQLCIGLICYNLLLFGIILFYRNFPDWDIFRIILCLITISTMVLLTWRVDKMVPFREKKLK